MQAVALKAVVAAALQQCRAAGAECDVPQLAYTACLLEEQLAWSATPTPAGQSPQQQQQQQLSLCASAAPLSSTALAAMAQCVAQAVLQPSDAHAAATAGLQLALEAAFRQQQRAVEAQAAAHADAAEALAAKVAHRKVNMQAAGLPLYQAVFQDVVEYVCAAAGLQARAAAGGDARAQVSAAVESAMPLSSLAFFLTLPAQERLQQLECLAAVATGICLFNSATGNAPSPLTTSAPTQLLQAERLLQAVTAAAADAEAALEHHNTPTQQRAPDSAGAESAGGDATQAPGTAEEGGSVDSSSSSGSQRQALPGLGAVLFCAQAAVLLRRVAADLAAGISCCRQLHQELEGVLTQAAARVAASSTTAGAVGGAVAKEVVFPLFESAGRLHHALSGELRLMLVRTRLWEVACAAVSAAADANASLPRVLGFRASSRRLTASAAAAGDAAAAASFNAASLSLPPGMEFVAAAGEQDQQQQQLALGGVCPVSVAGSVLAASGGGGTCAALAAAAGGGPLLLGRMARPELGAIRYEGHLFGFCSAAALAAFVDAPALALDAVRRAAAAAPLLHHLLGTTQAAVAPGGGGSGRPLSGHQSAAAAPSRPASAHRPGTSSSARRLCWARALPPLRLLLELLDAAPLKVDAGTQTVTHVHERLIDTGYEWNEWALRRRVIALANLRTKATHSAQTLLSAFRREGCSQTWLPKQAAAQTPVSRGSSVPRKLRHITGLRGAASTKVAVVALELDVHGTTRVGVRRAREPRA